MAIRTIAVSSTAKILTVQQYNDMQYNISQILGTGEGDYGYGQDYSSHELDPPPASLSGSHYDVLAADIIKARLHQIGGLATSIIPTAPAVLTATYIGKFVTQLKNAYDQRLVTPPSPSQATVNAAFAPNQITDEWNNTSTHQLQIDFGTAEDMRFYFNAGGQIQFQASRVNSTDPIPKSVSIPKNTSWSNLLKSLGTISFNRSATTSTSKIGNTKFGYSSLLSPTTGESIGPKLIYARASTDKLFLLNTYKITAEIMDTTEEIGSILQFTIEFTDGGVSKPDLNINGVLTSVVKTYRATGMNVEIPDPILVEESNIFVPGDAQPTYSVNRSVTSIKENGTLSGVNFEIVSTNLYTDTLVYWSIESKTGTINAEDFVDEFGTTLTTISNVPVYISSNTSGPIGIYARDDSSIKEGNERFNFVVRDVDYKSATYLTDLGTSFETILDTSTYIAPVPTPSVYFKTQSVNSYKEGSVAIFNIGARDTKRTLKVRWATIGVLGNITGSDFDGNDGGTFTISPSTTYVLKRLLNAKDGEDGTEQFKIELYLDIDGAEVLSDTSNEITIEDAFVPIKAVPTSVSTNGITSIGEVIASGVEFTVSAPMLKPQTKLYWKIYPDSDSSITASDFSSTYVLGGNGIGGTINDYITVSSTKTASLKRYAKDDSGTTGTEGPESFKVVFYNAFPLTANSIEATSPSVTITESVGYSIAATPSAGLNEGDSAGLLYTVGLQYTTAPKLFWWIPTNSKITSGVTGDFDQFSGSFDVINNNTGSFRIFPRADSIIEGDEIFQVQIRTAADGLGTLLITSPGEKITEPAVYTIDAGPTVAEGGSITYSITAPYTTTKLFWSVDSVQGTVNSSDFAQTTRDISFSNGVGNLTLTLNNDNSTEGTEEFKLVLRSGSANGLPVFTQLDTVLITEVVDYIITLTNSITSLSEGGAATTVRIVTPWTALNTPIYWTIIPVDGNITDADFAVVDDDTVSGTQNRLSGMARTRLVTSGTQTISIATFTLTAVNNANLTEGTETFQIGIRLKTTDVEQFKKSAIFSVTELVPFQVLLPTLSGNAITTIQENEGTVSGIVMSNSMTLTIKTPKRNPGTLLYWKAVPTAFGRNFWNSTTLIGGDKQELDQMYGIVTLGDNNTTTLTIVANADLKDEGNMSFNIELRELPTFTTPELRDTYITNQTYLGLTGTPVATTMVPIIIEDTSGTPEPDAPVFPEITGVTVSKVSVIEGEEVIVSIATTNATGHNVYWRVFSNTMLEADILEGFTSPAPLQLASNGTLDLTFTTVKNDRSGTKGFLVIFRFDSNSISTEAAGNSVAIEVTKEQAYSITPERTIVNEGSDLKVYITTPKSVAPATFQYVINPVSPTGASDADFTTVTGTVIILSDGTGNFTLSAISTDATEGNEQFTILLKSPSGTLIDPQPFCQTITISEAVGYSITSDTTEIYENPTVLSQKQAVKFTVYTPAMSAVTTYLKYLVVPVSGSIAYTDFTEYKDTVPTSAVVEISGQIAVTYHNDTGRFSGEFTLTANTDGIAEGNLDSFTIKIFTSDNIPIDFKAGTIVPTVSIKETGTYAISLTDPITSVTGPSNITKGTRVMFYVSTPYVPKNSNLYWKVITGTGSTAGEITVADFEQTVPVGVNKLSGTVLVDEFQRAVISLTPTKLAELKTFKIQISDVSESSGFKVDVACPNITVSQSQTFTINASPLQVYENNSVTFKITYPGITGSAPNSVANTLYWRINTTTGVTDGDFTNVSNLKGTIPNLSPTGGTYDLVLPILSDAVSESTKFFTVSLSLVPDSGFVVVTGGTSEEVSILDNGSWSATCQQITLLPNNIATYTLTVPASSTITKVYWELVTTALAGYFVVSAGAATGTTATSGLVDVTPTPHVGTTASAVIKVTTAVKYDPALTADMPFTLRFKEVNSTGTAIIVTCPAVSLSAGYSITPNGGDVDKTNGVNIKVKAPLNTTLIYWTLIDQGTSKMVGSDMFYSGAAAQTGSVTVADANNIFSIPTLLPVTAGYGKKFKIVISESSGGSEKISAIFNMPVADSKPIDTTTPTTSTCKLEYSPSSLAVGKPAEIVVCSVAPALAGTSYVIEWTLKSMSGVTVDDVQVTNGTQVSSAKAGGTITASTSNTSSVKSPVSGTAYANLVLSVGSNVKPGSFSVTFIATVNNVKLAPVTTPPINVSTGTTIKRFYTSGSVDITGLTTVGLIAKGGGGQGGGMANAYGGNGSNGDQITGNITVPSGSKTLSFKFVEGGKPVTLTKTSIIGMGGRGGTGIEISIDGTFIAVVAGGGGGGGGGPLPYAIMKNYATPPGVEPILHAQTTTQLSTRIQTPGGSPTGEGAGAGGYPGGAAGTSTRSVTQTVWSNNNQDSNPTTYDKCATGGNGGVTTVTDGSGLFLNSNTVITSTKTYTPTTATTGNWGSVLKTYGIMDTLVTDAKIIAQFNNVSINPATLTEYVLNVAADNTASIVIDNIPYDVSNTYARNIGTNTINIKLGPNWNRTIIASATNPGTYSEADNPYGIGASLSLNGTVVWHTRMPATVISTIGGGSGGGKGGRGVANSAVPVGSNLVPYLSGINGTAIVNSGELGEPAYLQITLLATSTVPSSDFKEWKSPGTASYIVPAGVTKVHIIVIGGGGGGGMGMDGSGTGSSGGGGGAGGYVEADVMVTDGDVLNITIGSGGVGGTGVTATKDGKVGTASSVILGSVGTLIANGGTGGLGCSKMGENTVTGGNSGTVTVSGTGIKDYTAPTPPAGQPGIVDGLYFDLVKSKNYNTVYHPGGTGANNGSKYGVGGEGGPSLESTAKKYPGLPGADGYVAIYWGAEFGPGLTPITSAATPPVIIPPVDTLTDNDGIYIGDLNGYKLFLSPVSTEDFKYADLDAGNGVIGAGVSAVDGYANTVTLNNTSHPAAQYCLSLTNGGHQWYLPAVDELTFIWGKRTIIPAKKGFGSYAYATSTKNGGDFTWYLNASTGVFANKGTMKGIILRCRAIRREAIPNSIGSAMEGGYFAGYWSANKDGVATHKIIIAPKSTEHVMGINEGQLGSLPSGLLPTGWMLPTRNQLNVCYYNLKPTADANLLVASLNQMINGANPYAVLPYKANTNWIKAAPVQTVALLFKAGNEQAFSSIAPSRSYLAIGETGPIELVDFGTGSHTPAIFGGTGKSASTTGGTLRGIKLIPMTSVTVMSKITVKCYHTANGNGQISVAFNDPRWTSKVVSYNVLYTPELPNSNNTVSIAKLTKVTTGNQGYTPRVDAPITTFTNGVSDISSAIIQVQAMNATGTVEYSDFFGAVFTETSFNSANTITTEYLVDYGIAFFTPGGTGTVTPPANVTSATIVCLGGGGGGGGSDSTLTNGHAGYPGTIVTATVQVSSSDILTIGVGQEGGAGKGNSTASGGGTGGTSGVGFNGGAGGNAGGANHAGGGGGGGSASYVMIGTNYLIVAAGGGGGGGGSGKSPTYDGQPVVTPVTYNISGVGGPGGTTASSGGGGGGGGGGMPYGGIGGAAQADGTVLGGYGGWSGASGQSVVPSVGTSTPGRNGGNTLFPGRQGRVIIIWN